MSEGSLKSKSGFSKCISVFLIFVCGGYDRMNDFVQFFVMHGCQSIVGV